jgi:ligand-binding sensor domain-containing protein/signal transduction histidine kinase
LKGLFANLNTRCLQIAGALAFLCAAWPCRALDPARTLTQYAHRIWDQEEGLFEPTVYSIAQTEDGFLWLGTQEGLARFDGLHFRQYEDSSGQHPFEHYLVHALAEDGHHNLWVASLGGGVGQIGATAGVKRYTAGRGLPSNNAFCLASRADAMWVCTNQGLARISPSGTRVFTTAEGLTSNQIRAACFADDGTLWVAGLDFGLNRRVGDRFEPYSDALLKPKENVSALLCGHGGEVWAGTSNGLFEITGGLTKHMTAQDGLSDDEISSLAESRDGSIWIGAHDGITRYRDNAFNVYRTRDGLSHSLVLALYTDREGSLWAGTKNGLDQFTDGKVTPYTVNEGLLGNDAGPIVQDAEGRLWVASRGRGLNVFENGRVRHITTADGLVGNLIMSMVLDKTGDVWVGTDKGLNRVRGTRIIATYTQREGLSGGEVRALSVDDLGTLWVGTQAGLDRFDGSRFQSFKPAEIGSAVNSLGAAPGEGLFASLGDSSFLHINDEALQPTKLDVSHPVDCYLLNEPDGGVWIGTLGSGLLRWKNGTITHLRIKDGLYDNRIYSMLRDRSGYVWFGSSKGIFRVSEKDLLEFAGGNIQRVTSVPFSTGQLRFECTSGVQPEAYRTHDGRLWFATNNGVVAIDPDHLRRNGVPPPVVVTAAIVNGRRMPSRTSIDIGLGSIENNVEIRYAGLSFISPEKVSFRYMLQGFDKTWTDAGERREAFFTNLRPGHFQFRVSARNADGVWSTVPATLDVRVEPRLYQRSWFMPTLVCAALLFGFGLYQRRIRRLRERFDLVLAERSRIGRELHDTLLQGLSGITMQMQALWTRLPVSRERTTLGEIIADAGRASREARDSLMGLRSETAAHGFAKELEILTRTMTRNSHLVVEVDAEPISLANFPELEFQLLRIAREALNNAMKHALASNVILRALVSGNRLRLTVDDDGIGMPTKAPRPGFGHYGIVGMRERADSIGAELTICNRAPCGTRVTVEVDLLAYQRRSNEPAEPEHLTK